MTRIPTPDDLLGTSASGAEPTTLCQNWQEGCNGVTDGPIDEQLGLCDMCLRDLAPLYDHCTPHDL
jgi:hypothetical protein